MIIPNPKSYNTLYMIISRYTRINIHVWSGRIYVPKTFYLHHFKKESVNYIQHPMYNNSNIILLNHNIVSYISPMFCSINIYWYIF